MYNCISPAGYQNNFALSAGSSLVGRAIALLTPYEGGAGVYAARVMLGIFPDEYGVVYRQQQPTTLFHDQLVKVFPNPAKDNITVEFTEEVELDHCTIELYSVHGRRLFEAPVYDNQQVIQVADLPYGIYFYRVIDSNSIFGSGKLIIKP